eukprot:c10179_g1_i2.p2 GENE.c10179_g1_i2~~c10179_g1_i2.p2  ORF type:complete len:148 (+),score=24.54 c10179_g1_i2:80-523(+)
MLHLREAALDLHQFEGGAALLRCVAKPELDIQVRAAAAWALGSSMQNNEAAQIKCLDLGIADVLESTATSGGGEALIRKSLFAIGALVRSSPTIQTRLLDSGHLARWAQAGSRPGLERLQRILLDVVDEGVEPVASAVRALLGEKQA